MDYWNGDPMHEVCIPHSNTRVVRNLEEKNLGTKENSPKQDLTSAKDLTIELLEVHESPNHRIDYLTNLFYILISKSELIISWSSDRFYFLGKDRPFRRKQREDT